MSPKEKPIWWEYRDLKQCPSCAIVIGGIEEHYIGTYRGHRLCDWCVENWKHREKLAEHQLSYGEFIEDKEEAE